MALGVPVVICSAIARTPSNTHDLRFALLIGGLAGVWMGGGNFLTRRFVRHRWGPLGTDRAAWQKRGFFILPDWLSIPILLIGVLSMLVGAVLYAL